jgi:hypothetical protein
MTIATNPRKSSFDDRWIVLTIDYDHVPDGSLQRRGGGYGTLLGVTV